MITEEQLLGAGDLAVLDGVARTLAARGDRVDDPAWVARARRGWQDTPAALRRVVSDFHAALRTRGQTRPHRAAGR